MEQTVLLARQPVFDVNNRMFACEILYRGTLLESPEKNRNSQATREVLVNACTSVLNDNINLGLPMLINIDEEFLLSDQFFPVAPQNLIFEILETVPTTEEILNKIRMLRRQGFEFALDDYVLESSKIPFFKYLKIIKVDILAVNMPALKKVMTKLKSTGCMLLAEKVESLEVYEECKALGFDLFQGYYLERPTQVEGKKIGASQQTALRLVSELSRQDIEVAEVAELISQDPILTLKILSLINCPLYQLVRDVNSVRDAVIILGLRVVKQWAMILTLVAESNRPLELFRTLLTRAKTLELYSQTKSDQQHKLDASECFLVGILSGIDAVLEASLENILEHLKLNQEIKLALLSQNNDLGIMLKNSIGIERFDSHIFETLSNQEICSYNRCYRKALAWADEVLSYLPA
ncbi:HDOD domain-containing protein [Aliiglaciecola sp. LCG003]|uniref:EAL and HDOD domain-containing protein n=1 Tax=Aliiglaciecola sp. LCG003 TaxID=3053655 RepID=UPI002573426E|nr:HDOD domain-containing protein [Aliiglaciecola sp. LCG003]WJG10885.1 HDOD domain-containing protein [Aliiglaciecola sp. LCG003]